MSSLCNQDTKTHIIFLNVPLLQLVNAIRGSSVQRSSSTDLDLNLGNGTFMECVSSFRKCELSLGDVFSITEPYFMFLFPGFVSL